MEEDNGDFQKIYETYQPKILRYMARLVGEDEAEDLTQEVFIKAGSALPGFRGESSLSTWLYRIATHRAYDRLRSPSFQRMAPKRQVSDFIGEEVEEVRNNMVCTGEKQPQVEQQLVQKEMSECILSYVARLPESYRTVLLLSDMEEFSNKEIAEILGVTLDTVKIRLHRARARLREEFVNHCEYYWVSELSWRAI
jgi:RNA polymerase sigma-70 factor (ECF subfamily)